MKHYCPEMNELEIAIEESNKVQDELFAILAIVIILAFSFIIAGFCV